MFEDFDAIQEEILFPSVTIDQENDFEDEDSDDEDSDDYYEEDEELGDFGPHDTDEY